MLFKKLVTDFVTEYSWHFIIYVILIILFYPIESLVLPKIYGIMFDQIKNISKFSDIFNFRENISKMNFPGSLVLLVIVWCVAILAEVIKSNADSKLVPAYFAYLKKIVFEKTMNSYKDNYSDMKTGDYLSRVVELTRNIKDLFHMLLSSFFPELIVSLLIVVYMLFQHRILGGILIAGIVLCVIVHWFTSQMLIDLVADREDYINIIVSENIRDSLDNMMNVFLSNEIDNEIGKNDKLEKESQDKFQHIMYIQSIIVFVIDFIVILTFAVGLIFLYYLISKKEVKVSHGIVLVIILGQFLTNFLYINNKYIRDVLYRLGIILSSKEYMENLFVTKNTRTTTSGITNGNILFKNVSFRYDKTKDVFVYDNLNLELEAGKHYALVGQSGGGKTTLMKMVVGLYAPETGSIYIDNTDVSHMDLTYLRDNVNYINQRTNLFNESVMYNILYGNPDATEEDVNELLHKYDLINVYDALPDGLNSIAGVNGGNLSGGMQRVTMLIRGLLKPCKILIIDEPTTGLDENTARNVKKMIIEETVGKTMIVITHSKLMLSSSGMSVLDVSKLKA
jgi:ABC-type multidrug transport system fused ATPase/permease subunit